mmetsp:Transcript_71463/g.168395  ORF Transcript_71463/g.168395 Transcript_71463/m.168395 type:complete len:289 (-) Transcript_71463:2509-3375(-)
MPPSLAPSRNRSLGHFSRMRSPAASSVSAMLQPTASDRPDRSTADGSGSASEKVSAASSLCQARPSRPRPAVWRPADSSSAAPPSRRCRSASVLVEPHSARWRRSIASAARAAGFGREHGAAAGRRAAPAGELLLDLGGVALVQHQAVVVEQLLAGLQVAQGLDEDAAVDLVGLAVGLAGMVDPARIVAAVEGVDHQAAVEVEVEGVVGLLGVVGMAAHRLVPADALAGVLDDLGAGGNRCHGIDATAVHAGVTDFDLAAWGFSGHRPCGTVISWVRACVGVRARPGL